MKKKSVLSQMLPWIYVILGLIACFYLGIAGLLKNDQTAFGYFYSIYFLVLGVALIIFMAGSTNIMDLFITTIKMPKNNPIPPQYIANDEDLKKRW